MKRIFLSLIYLILLASCGGGGGERQATTSALTCDTNSDCGSGFICSASNICIIGIGGGSCTIDSDCTQSGQICINGTCANQNSVNLSDFQTCEYYGHTSISGNAVECTSALDSSTLQLSNVTADNNVSNDPVNASGNDWLSGAGYMRVAEAYALLEDLGVDSATIKGSGVSVAILGTGVNNVVSTDTDGVEINIDSTNSANYGYAAVSSSDGSIYNELTREYGNIDRTQFRDASDDSAINYTDVATTTTGSVCDSDDTSSCDQTIYLIQERDVNAGTAFQYEDTDQLTIGTSDVADGTSLAGIIAKDESANGQGIASEAEIVSVKTMFTYEKTSEVDFDASDNNDIFRNDSFIIQDNTAELARDALIYAKSVSDIVLLNNQLRDDTNYAHQHYFLADDGGNISISCDVDADGSECGSDGGTNDYIADDVANGLTNTNDNRAFNSIINSDTNSFYTDIKNELDETTDIYVVPVANTDYSSLVATSNSDGRSYETLIAVADVNVAGISYCSDNSTGNCALDSDNNGVVDLLADGTDENGIVGINTITIGTSSADTAFKSDSRGNIFDCAGISSDNCVIAPGNFYALQSDGSYDVINDDEYAGSAYVAGIIASIRAVYTEAELSNEAIIDKIIETATDPSQILVVNSDSSTTSCADSTEYDCGAGMINFYEVIKANVADEIAVSTSSSASFSLANSNVTLSAPFGDGFSSNSMGILSQAKFFDDFNFGYNAGLETKVVTAEPTGLLASDLLENQDVITENIPVNFANLAFNITSTEDNQPINKHMQLTDAAELEPETNLNNFSFSEEFAGFALQLGIAQNNGDHLNFAQDLITSGSGYNAFALGQTDNITISRKFAKKFSLISQFSVADNSVNQLVTADYHSPGKFRFAATAGILTEDDAILGAKTSGAFGESVSADTTYLNLQFLKYFGDFELYANFTSGVTTANFDENSILTNADRLESQEFSFALSKNLDKNSKFGIGYSEALAITAGSVDVTVATSGNSDGSQNFTVENVSLESLGQERNYEIFFQQELSENSSMTINYVRTTDVDNISGEDNDVFAINFKTTF